MNVSTIFKRRKSQPNNQQTPYKTRDTNQLSSSVNLFSKISLLSKKPIREEHKTSKIQSPYRSLLSSAKNSLHKRKSQPYFNRIYVNQASSTKNLLSTSQAQVNPNHSTISPSNTLTVNLVKQKRTYFILPGNNTALIKRCLSNRPNWIEGSSVTSCNFVWAPVGTKVRYSHILRLTTNTTIQYQTINHFEYYNQLTNKSNLFINLVSYCERKNIDLFTFIPFTILMQYDHRNYIKQFRSFSFFCSNIEEFSKKEKKRKYSDLFTIDSNEKLGHKTNLYLPEIMYNGRNLWLVKATNLNRGQCIKVADSPEDIQIIIRNFYNGIDRKFTPENEKKEKELRDKEKNEKKEEKKEESKEIITVTKQKSSFMRRKDSTDLIRKQGSNTITTTTTTTIANGINNSFIQLSTSTKNYRANKTILQKYIEKPLLYQGRKFDIRIWVLLTQEMSLYVFKQGHLKASSEVFDIQSKNSFVHLTNYSVQKYNERFSLFEYGNEISFEDFQRDLIQQNKTVSVMNDIFPKLCNIIVISMKAVKDRLNISERKNSFEIFGYDFMLDNEFNPYLLEVNTNPGLEESSPLISMLVPRMIDDAFRLTIDTIYNDSNIKDSYVSPFPVTGYPNPENMWKELTEFKE